MRILIDGRLAGAHAWGFVFQELGDSPTVWNPADETAFDVFDRIKPSYFLGHVGGVDRALRKCLEEHQPTTALYVTLAKTEDGSLDVVEQERQIADIIEHEMTLHAYYLTSVSGQKSYDVPFRLYSIPHAVDIRGFTKPDPLFKCDFAVIGKFADNTRGYSDHILPVVAKCYGNKQPPHIQIYGDSTWRVPNDVGYLSPADYMKAMASAMAVPVISGDVCPELPYLFFQAVLVSDWVGTDSEDTKWLDIEDMPFFVMAEQETLGLTWFETKNVRDEFLKNHTYFDRYKMLRDVLYTDSWSGDDFVESVKRDCIEEHMS